jgi:hypothetical protein
MFTRFTGPFHHFGLSRWLAGPTRLVFSPVSPVHFIIPNLAAGRPNPYSPSVFTSFAGSFHHFRTTTMAARSLVPWRFHRLHRFISSLWTWSDRFAAFCPKGPHFRRFAAISGFPSPLCILCSNVCMYVYFFYAQYISTAKSK